jgi:hypothetical protein
MVGLGVYQPKEACGARPGYSVPGTATDPSLTEQKQYTGKLPRGVRLRLDRSLIREAAYVLEANPGIRNHQLLALLAKRLDPALIATIPVNSVEARLREPAMQLLRRGIVAGDEDSRGSGTAVKDPRANRNGTGTGAASGSEQGPQRGRGGTTPSADLVEELEALLEKAFLLGAGCENMSDIPARYAELDDLRERLRRSIAAS